MDENTSQPNAGTAFNMGVATLQRIDAILKDITNISKRTDINPNHPTYLPRNHGQHQKIKLVKELYLNSFVLMKDESAEALKGEVLGLSPQFKITDSAHGKRQAPAYSEEIETTIFDLILKISQALGENKVFMPDKRKEGLF